MTACIGYILFYKGSISQYIYNSYPHTRITVFPEYAEYLQFPDGCYGNYSVAMERYWFLWQPVYSQEVCIKSILKPERVTDHNMLN